MMITVTTCAARLETTQRLATSCSARHDAEESVAALVWTTQRRACDQLAVVIHPDRQAVRVADCDRVTWTAPQFAI